VTLGSVRRAERPGRVPLLRHCARAAVLALLLVAVSASAAPIANPESPESPEAAAVKRGFAEYKAALKQRDGVRAAAAVSSNSFRYYDRMRRLALSAARDELEQLEGTERMLVLALRQQAPLELLANGTPEELVAHAVTTDAITDTSVARTELGEIRREGDLSRGWIIVDGTPMQGVLQFALEGDRWKFDLEFAMKSSAGLIAAIAKESGLPEDEVILILLGQGGRQPVGPEIWQPPMPK
jgi:hypothetical protein